MKIGTLPSDGRYLFGGVRALRITVPFLVLQEQRKDRGVVKDDTVGYQTAAFRPIKRDRLKRDRLKNLCQK
jgi:hypothetical protein